MSRRLALGIAVTAIGSLASASTAHQARPPSSVRPTVERRPVRIVHRHERVHRCKRVTDEQRARCVAELTPADSAAVIGFHPLAVPNSVGPEARSPVVAEVPAGTGPQETSVELPLGQWHVEWEGHASGATLSIRSTSAPLLSLATTSGRCQLLRSQCRRDDSAQRQLLTITD